VVHVRRRRPKGGKVKRFTVTLDVADHAELNRIADTHVPPVTASYLVTYAVRLFLQSRKDPQRRLDFGSGAGDIV
jgi:hypothetical protein